jgi:hypothetical protein
VTEKKKFYQIDQFDKTFFSVTGDAQDKLECLSVACFVRLVVATL